MTRTHIVVVTGAGGVGKTTVSAALAIGAAAAGTRTLVVTIDPAKRLASALGVDSLGNQPSMVPGTDGLWAAMLDITASWEAIVHRHAAPEVADRLESNPFFRAIADRFPAAQAYAAGEQMAEYSEGGAWELVIVDTPPSAGGLDFYLAPRRMRELVGGRLLRWLTGASLPGRRALYRVTARPMLRVADSVLGGPLLEDIAEFLLDLRTLYDGLSSRARSIERLLGAATTLVVTTAAPASLREVRRFYSGLGEISVTPAATIFNRDLPKEWMAPKRLPAIAGLDAEEGAILRENLRRWGDEARKTQDAKQELMMRHHTDVHAIPWLEDAPTTVAELAALAETADLTGLLQPPPR
ncbi:MAG TPA: ArsA-related P-loop ATPase [Acidimicrobiia bacterium]